MNSAEVRYITRKTVKPTATLDNPEKTQRIHLTPWDLRLLTAEYHQGGHLYIKPQNYSPLAFVKHLLNSLAHTLDYFYPLAGRLATQTHQDDKTISFFIDCNMAGAEFIHAAADVSVSDVLGPLYVPEIIHSFFPLNGVINIDGQSQPLLSVQVTELMDGVFIGCSMNHVVCDGTSFSHFMNSWSQLSRSFSHNPQSPVFKRWFLNHSYCPVWISPLNDDQLVARYTPPLLLERFFHFSPQSLAKLKAIANAEQETTTISSLQSLLGHVWRAVTRARCLGWNQEVNYVLVIGNRGRLNPKLPEEYFGNSLQRATATAKAGELIEKGLGWAAWLLNQAVAAQDDALIRKTLEDWLKKPVFVSRAKDFGHSLITKSSPRFNMYGNDFGWGRPIASRTGFADKADGVITVYPGQVEGSVDVEACLLPQTLMVMGGDKEFMEFVTVFPFVYMKSLSTERGRERGKGGEGWVVTTHPPPDERIKFEMCDDAHLEANGWLSPIPRSLPRSLSRPLEFSLYEIK